MLLMLASLCSSYEGVDEGVALYSSMVIGMWYSTVTATEYKQDVHLYIVYIVILL